MTLLFDLVQRHSGGAAAAAPTATTAASPAPPHESSAPSSAATSSGAQPASGKGAVSSSSVVVDPPAPPLLQSESSAPDYNLAALSDPALLQDRTMAFEAFRRSYRKHEQMAACHDELQQRVATAKGVAGEINALIERMKAVKARVLQLRAERALSSAPDTVDPEEAALLQQLDQEQRPRYAAQTEALKAEKEAIQHLQLLIKRGQEQLLRDFEAWFGARQAQISAAMTATAGGAAKPSVAALSARSANGGVSAAAPAPAAASAAPTAPRTGNPAVDAEIARMYEARAALRAKMVAGLPT